VNNFLGRICVLDYCSTCYKGRKANLMGTYSDEDIFEYFSVAFINVQNKLQTLKNINRLYELSYAWNRFSNEIMIYCLYTNLISQHVIIIVLRVGRSETSAIRLLC